MTSRRGIKGIHVFAEKARQDMGLVMMTGASNYLSSLRALYPVYMLLLCVPAYYLCPGKGIRFHNTVVIIIMRRLDMS